ncbi:MAG: hypothetical protein IIC40_07790 [Candidatus Marinimicrobia bacterium]|nr:hypothetical protein [Candidatus Neomarinimicrobiota bacterium]
MSDKGVNALYYYFIPHSPAVNSWANNSDYADHSVKCGLRFTLTATYLYGLYYPLSSHYCGRGEFIPIHREGVSGVKGYRHCPQT